MREKTNYLYWIPVFLVCVIIFYFSSRTGSESNAQSDPIVELLYRTFSLNRNYTLGVITFVRKSGHILEFALLAFTLIIAVEKTFTGKYKFLSAFVLAYLYAAFDEIHQLFVVGRSGRFSDTLVDSVGIILGLLVYRLLKYLYLRFKRKK